MDGNKNPYPISGTYFQKSKRKKKKEKWDEKAIVLFTHVPLSKSDVFSIFVISVSQNTFTMGRYKLFRR